MKRTTRFLLTLALLTTAATGAWAQSASGWPFEDGDYVIQNVATGYYLNTGVYPCQYGTKAQATEISRRIKLTKEATAGQYLLDAYVSNGGKNHFLNYNLFFDGPGTPYTIEKGTADGQYIIRTNYEGTENNNHLTAPDAFGNVVLGNDATAANAQWRIMPVTGNVLTEGGDATYLIWRSNFNRQWNGQNLWQGSGAAIPGKCQYDFEWGNWWVESENQAFDYYQEITGVPTGLYKVRAQAGVKDYAETGENLPEIYLSSGQNTVSVPFVIRPNNASDEAADIGKEQLGAGMYTTDYTDVIYVTDGKLTVGARGTRTDTYCIFDNFQLIFMGTPESTFNMPTHDVTATYTIKRDISVDVDVTVQDAQQNSRFRVQNQGNSFVPVGLTNEQVMALFKVHDDIESKDLTAITDYTVQIFAADDNDQPTGTAMTFSNFTYAPGKYVVKAVAAEGSNYSGETALSNVFTLFQGYEVTVPAKEFITYYKDEPLYVEDEAALLYTITSVTDTEAVLSEKSDAMPSNTPMLVYNKSNETKTFLLIPCAEPDMDITVAPEFQGTLTGTTIAASTENQTNYAFNGKQFVWVKDALEVGPNKAWLEIPIGMMAGAREINLVFGEATKITTTNITNITNGDWYDLNGRKLQGIPTKKGVYIFNGKKVVVK